MDTTKARDLIVRCFYEAQKETLARARKRLGQSDDEEKLFSGMESMVRTVFKECGVDYNTPSPEDLHCVIEVLARKAEAWGTPDDIIEHHKGQIEKILSTIH